ncbi:MAG TPA: hypothetical protein VGV38_17135 [Pyrinomonadaceae bacterium]|nr:hypothetical protein [Pyrinomonadaceae bacterium]
MPISQDEFRVQPEDPPPLVSGMLTLSLDPQGRLAGLLAVPPQVEEPAGQTAQTPDWNTLFAEAGLNPADFRETQPKWVPLVESDARAAWEGTYPGQPEPKVSVEAASFRGRPVYFQVVGPWSRPERMQPFQPTTNEKVSEVIVVLVFLIILTAAAFIARRNWKLGRGDVRGASRLALYGFSVAMLYWVMRASHVPALAEEVFLFIRGLQVALLFGALIWLFYLALEPYVRRWWPHRIISWKRLLSGDFRDPLVGRDLLVGGLFGVGAALVSYARRPAAGWLGLPPAVPVPANINTLEGVRAALGEFFFVGMLLAVYSALLSFFLFFLLRLILRKGWLAAGVFWLFITVSTGLRGGAITPEQVAFDLAAGGLLGLLLVLALTRFGLLSLIAAQFFIHLCTNYPLATDLGAWYADSGLLAVALALAFAVYGFHTSLAGQPLFRGGFLQE